MKIPYNTVYQINTIYEDLNLDKDHLMEEI